MSAPIATIASQTASLTVAVFDAASATDWIHTKAAATKAQFTGTPAQIMRGLGKGEEVAQVDVGPSAGWAFELEGKSGRMELYRLDATTLALVAPPRATWTEANADAIFAAALSIDAIDDADEIGEVELDSGKLAAVYIWHKKVGAARELAAQLPAGGAATFGDGYGDGDGGLVVDVGKGTYALRKREEDGLAVMYVRATSSR